MTSQMFKASTASNSFNDGADFANVSSSNASNSLNESGLQSNADAQSQISSVGHFYGGSNPSSTNSSPQQFINPKSENLSNHPETVDSDMN